MNNAEHEKSTLPAPFQIFEQVMPIAPNDMHGGHVNNARYFAYIGQAFEGWYEAMGLGVNHPNTAGPMMAHMEYDYLQEMKYPGNVLCKLTVVRVGRSSLEHAIEIHNQESSATLCGRGKAVNVWVNRMSKQAEPWPEGMISKCWNGGLGPKII